MIRGVTSFRNGQPDMELCCIVTALSGQFAGICIAYGESGSDRASLIYDYSVTAGGIENSDCYRKASSFIGLSRKGIGCLENSGIFPRIIYPKTGNRHAGAGFRDEQADFSVPAGDFTESRDFSVKGTFTMEYSHGHIVTDVETSVYTTLVVEA